MPLHEIPVGGGEGKLVYFIEQEALSSLNLSRGLFETFFNITEAENVFF